jgi:hypothetical protein
MDRRPTGGFSRADFAQLTLPPLMDSSSASSRSTSRPAPLLTPSSAGPALRRCGRDPCSGWATGTLRATNPRCSHCASTTATPSCACTTSRAPGRSSSTCRASAGGRPSDGGTSFRRSAAPYLLTFYFTATGSSSRGGRRVIRPR